MEDELRHMIAFLLKNNENPDGIRKQLENCMKLPLKEQSHNILLRRRNSSFLQSSTSMPTEFLLDLDQNEKNEKGTPNQDEFLSFCNKNALEATSTSNATEQKDDITFDITLNSDSNKRRINYPVTITLCLCTYKNNL